MAGGYRGRDGTVKIADDKIAEVTSWSLTETISTIDTTSFDNQDYETFKPNLKSWSGSIDCLWEKTDKAGQEMFRSGAEVVINLYLDGEASGSKYYTGNVMVTDVNTTSDATDVIKVSFTFQGTGVLQYKAVA